jgi:Lon protease-like protein
MSSTVQIDFSRPIALFPLPAVALFPHTAEWMVAFEPRYRQMVEDCLRARGEGPLLDAAPIALATYAGRGWSGERVGEPALRPAVCVAKIVEHRALPDGKHHMLLHGFCRARIDSIAEPEGRRLYRLARLAPVERRQGAPRRMPVLEGEIASLIEDGELARWPALDAVRMWVRRRNLPTEFIVEQLVAMLSSRDADARYRLLAEPNGRVRARFALSELAYLRRMVGHASTRSTDAERGVIAN